MFDNELLKLREENKGLTEKLAQNEEERKRLSEQVDQAMLQGKRQAVIEMAKMKAKSTTQVGTQTMGIPMEKKKVEPSPPPA